MNFQNIIGIGTSTLVLQVTNEEGEELNDGVSIIWYDANGKEIGIGAKLNGIAESAEVYYSVILNESLGRVYREVKMQKVLADGENKTITCQLEKIGRVMLEGRVSATDIDKTTAMVNVKQMLNGKWEQTYTTQTDEQGVFSVEVYDDETDITVSGDGYLDAALHRERFGESGNVGTIPLNLISGFSVAANVTMRKAVVAGEAEDETTWAEGLNNIEFSLTNTTKSMAITDFTVQNGSVIIKTGADVGDEISLTAKSKQGIFADATATFIIVDGANAFDLQLTELGGMDATCTDSNNGVTVGYLYNSNGVLTAKGSYTGETLSLRHLPAGTYTLITMGGSTLLNNITRLSDIVSVGLSEGADYIAADLEIKDGELTAVAVNEVPRLDDTRFYYTSGETYFSVNKTSVTAGNYLTLQVHVDFKAEYADRANGVTLTIDLPEGCQMVENSVIVNRQAAAHTVNGGRLTIPLTKEQYESQLRFCVIPTLNQSFAITAMASFDIDGQVTQPIGTAQFEAKGLSLSVPEYVVNTNVTINGTAKGHSDVSIYDNEVLIGKTTSKADGSWTAECELFKPYSYSFHDIYAKITTESGMELTSEVRQVEYDKNGNVPEKVTMLYYNYEYDKQYNIVFDLIKGETMPSSYDYFPFKNSPNWWQTLETEPKEFTFLADFTRNDSTEIKNVNIKVLHTDGTVRTIPTTFDGKQNKWVATTKYENSNRLPQNVKVEYSDCNTIIQVDSARIHSDWIEFKELMLSNITNIDTTNSKILESTDSMIIYQYQTTKMDFPIYMKVEELTYGDWIDKLEIQDYIIIEKEGKVICMLDSILESNYISWFWTKEDAKMMKIEFFENTNSSEENNREKAPSRASTIGGNIVDGFCPLNICGIHDIIQDYNTGYNNYLYWMNLYIKTLDNHNKLYKETIKLLNAKCKDGSSKLDPSIYDIFKDIINYDYEDAKWMHNNFERNLKTMERNINEKMNLASALTAFSSLISGVVGAGSWAGYQLTYLGSSLFGTANNFVGWGVNKLIDNSLDWFDDKSMRAWFNPENKRIEDAFIYTQHSIVKAYKYCSDNDDDDNDDDDFDGDDVTPEIDPSGYVYEAVTSNRLEGVTVTCYQKVQSEDMYGDITEEAVVWNAEDYSQRNPLKTDETGFYRWDVPQGLWQVKYEKEGYETTYSDWLPVPPPQLDVNIGMKQSTPPSVTQMRGYESGITIDLSKYMRPETMTTDHITVTRNGSTEKGCIELLNAEKAPLGDEIYVSKVKFVPNNHFSASDIVVVTVRKEVESYCGVKMTTDHVETVKIEPEVKSIEVDSILTVVYQGEKELRVQILPIDASVGKTLHVRTSSEMIASLSSYDVMIDQDGFATLVLFGELPGGAVLNFSVDGTDVTATSKVKVVISKEMVATPTASIANGSTVNSGTQLTLTCATEGATIYYTLDGSCPCNEQTRILYTEPIVLPVGTITVNAIAIADGMDDSEVMSCIYNVRECESIIFANNMWRTYCSAKPLYFTNADGLNAYIASGYSPSEQEVIMTRVEKVPAKTGLLLEGEAGKTYAVPVAETSYMYSNLLVGVLKDTEVESGFVFNRDFFEAINEPYLVKAGEAYLSITAGNVSQLNLRFTDTDGVESVPSSDDTGNWHTLQGIRLNVKPNQKGVYINSGRKVLVK